MKAEDYYERKNMATYCAFCKTEITYNEEYDVWVDDTDGDGCWGDNNENGIHWPVEGE